MKSKQIVGSAAAVFLAVTTLGAATALAEVEAAPDQVPSLMATEGLLTQNRVKATVTWKSPGNGQAGTATVIPQGDEFAYFTFSTAANPEVFVKALGTNDPKWIQLFASGVTSFEYTVTFAGCGQTKSFTQKANEKTRFDDAQGFPIAGCVPWSNEITVTLPGGVPLTVVRVAAGTYQMGSPATERSRENDETAHSVTLTSDWYMGKTEVTQGQWQAVMGSPIPMSCGNYGVGSSYPVYCVSWNDIRGTGGFLEKLNAYLVQTGQPGAGKFRLPTEAEWERAARAGTTTRFSFGDATTGADACGGNADAEPYAWWCGNDTPYGIKAAGTKKANAYGLLDMHGNAWELVEDWYGNYPAGPATDPAGPKAGTYRVTRGGGWGGNLSYGRSAQRNGSLPTEMGNAMGFRLARSY